MDSSATIGLHGAIARARTAANRDDEHAVRSSEICDSDETLIVRVQIGDREALSLLFRRYARPIRNIGQRILRDKAEAEDLVQEVFLYIHRRSGLFDSTKGSARSWIVQVAYTQAFLRRRRLKARGLLLSGIADNAKEIELRTGSGADYDQTVEGLLGRKVLALLTEDQRETLRLYFFEGYTFPEIADKLGQSFFNIRHHYYRGLETVRKNLAEKTPSKRRPSVRQAEM